MTTKLSAFCDGILEAGWLATSFVTPLFFNIYTASGVDFEKLALVRALALGMAGVWLVKQIERRTAEPLAWTAALRLPLVLPAILLVLVYIVASLTSVVPRISWWGEYHRPEGALAILAYVVIFVLVLDGLRTRAQLDRLVWTTCFTSVPVALYAMIQKLGLDPLGLSGYEGRAESSMGNPIFLGAYAIVIFFLALAQLLNGVRAQPIRHANFLRASFYATVLILQTLAFLFAESRGPLVGWLAGAVVFGLLLGVLFNRQKLLRAGFVLAGVGVLVVGAVNLPGSPLADFRQATGIGRLINLTPAPGSSADARLWYWRGVSRLVAPHAPIQFPDGAHDTLNAIRPLVGYGPDSLLDTFTQFYPPEMRAAAFRDEMLDRSHNETWNAWATVGGLGWLAYQFLFLSVTILALQTLGLMATPRERNGLIALWFGLGGASALGVLALGWGEYLGVAFPLGTFVALALYLARLAFRARAVPPARVACADQILIAGLIAGIFAHYIETQFGIAVIVTRIEFWLFAALLTALGVRQLDAPGWVGETDQREALRRGLIVADVLIILIFGFVIFAEGVTDPLVILGNALIGASAKPTGAVFGLIAFTALLGIVSAATEMRWINSRREIGMLMLVALGAPAGFAFGLVWQLSDLARVSQATIPFSELAAYANRFIALYDYWLGAFALGVLALGAACGAPARVWARQRASWLALAGITILMLGANHAFNLEPLRAGVYRRLARGYEERANWGVAAALSNFAAQRAPGEDLLFQLFGRALARFADSANVTTLARFGDYTRVADVLALDAPSIAALNRNDALFAAQILLLRARDLNPLFTDHSINLARFYLPALPVDTDGKRTLADLSAKYYAQAARLSPTNVILLNEWAKFDFEYRADSDAALEKLDRSLQLDAQFGETYDLLARVFAARQDWSRAAATYQRAVARAPRLPEAWSRLAFAFYQQEKLADAIAAYQQYLTLAPTARNAWEARKNLALLYERTGDLAAAVREAQASFESAPPEFKPQLSDLVARLRAAGKP